MPMRLPTSEEGAAYVRLQDAATELAAAADAMAESDPAFNLVAGLCHGVAGLLLDPECWPESLPPAAEGIARVVRAGLPDAKRRLEAESVTN